MARIPLVSAPYAGQSLISSGQERVNLYAEINASMDKQSPAPVTEYQTPGTSLAAVTVNTKVRGEYRTSIGTAYCVVGSNVYYLTYDQITDTITPIQIGFVADIPTQVYFKDNGLVVILVDGTNGYAIDMTSNDAVVQIIDPNFYGADFVDLLDTFFIFNRPDTNQFYISASNASFAMLTNTAIATGDLVNAGSSYTAGTYQNVPLIGGSGTGATATITVAGFVVTNVSIQEPGQGYIAGDLLSANNADIGFTGSGLIWRVATLASAFDPLDIAAKSGFNDPIVGLVAVHAELWLVGNLTSEVWIGTGAADFYFQRVQGAFINHGSAAKYSIACQDVLVFFIQQDMQGNGLVLQGQGYDVSEISTPRIVKEFKSYVTLSDAIGFCFQVSDHAFYALAFPTANKGWLYDLSTKEWSEWNYCDSDGNLNRPRANCCMLAFGKILVGDWENGNILHLDPNVGTDYTTLNAETNIVRIRTYPHSVDEDYNRVSYPNFEADMTVGSIDDYSKNPIVSLSWSNDRGKTYGNPVQQGLGKKGEYLTSISWNRLGMARDRVFKIQWSENIPDLALNGGFIDKPKASKS